MNPVAAQLKKEQSAWSGHGWRLSSRSRRWSYWCSR